ncbi:EF-hand domain-containing protein [Granulosicoccus sp. 3-233]|uniref:EF-hand domain-containing protein n=1 Tax=Granulosicoccus sp. 3-233 TaxID=3417969 RepID=UPI003D33AB4D
MKPVKSISMILASALVLGTVGVVANAQDGNSETIDEQLLAQDSGQSGERERGHGKGGHDKRRMADGARHGKRGQGGPGLMVKLLKSADADGDGVVTQAEIDTFKAAQLSGADSNADGALNIEEFDTIYRALTRSRMVDMFQDLDEDGDGVISAAELDDRVSSVVARMDRNDDGTLTREDGRRHGGNRNH